MTHTGARTHTHTCARAYTDRRAGREGRAGRPAHTKTAKGTRRRGAEGRGTARQEDKETDHSETGRQGDLIEDRAVALRHVHHTELVLYGGVRVGEEQLAPQLVLVSAPCKIVTLTGSLKRNE